MLHMSVAELFVDRLSGVHADAAVAVARKPRIADQIRRRLVTGFGWVIGLANGRPPIGKALGAPLAQL